MKVTEIFEIDPACWTIDIVAQRLGLVRPEEYIQTKVTIEGRSRKIGKTTKILCVAVALILNGHKITIAAPTYARADWMLGEIVDMICKIGHGHIEAPQINWKREDNEGVYAGLQHNSSKLHSS